MSRYNYAVLIVATGQGADLEQIIQKRKLPALPPLRRLVTLFQQAGLNNISVVAPENLADTVKKDLSRMGVRFLIPSSEQVGDEPDAFALECFGLKEFEADIQRIFIATENTPFFRLETVEQLMQAKHLPVVPSYDGIGGHPLLIDAVQIPNIVNAVTTKGMQGALVNAKITKHYINVADEGSIMSLSKITSEEAIVRQLTVSSIRPATKLMLVSSHVFFGPGAAQLLRLIEETGSVREASTRMNISYSKAWKILNTIREQTGFETVFRQQGGVSGGSAKLTEKGKELLTRYTQFSERCNNAIETIFNEIFECD